MDFTARQLAAIRLADPPRDTCVVAGPGSGKTTVLIERFRQLMESGIPAARILAITFTEKATHQMRERLTERAAVSTVHGLCARLLRENAIEAGVDPHFRVLDPQEAAAIELRAVSESLDAFLAECPAAIRALLAALASPDLGGSVLEVYETMRAAGTPVGQLRGGMPRADGQAALSALLDTCDRLAGERVFDWNASQREQLNGVLEWAGQLRGAGLRPAREHFQILESFRVDLNRIKKSGAAAGLLHALKKDQIPAARAALITDFYSPQRDTLLAAIERFDAAFRAHKRSLSALDFADLEESTVRLLQDHPAVREGVRAQFDCILMDEFQDTNGLQSKLLDLLRRPDCFYAVGDINQAIYGFRHADPEIFRAYREQVRRDGKQLAELRENWRSRPGILRAVSAILDGASGIEPHELIAARDFPAKAEPSVEVLSCIGADSADALALEAQWVARRIRELHERAPFRDFAVLFRSSTHIGVFTREFDQAGIPYSVTGAKGFYEAQEVADLIHLLRVVANARDEVSLAAVMRSPLAGVSDEALLRLRQSGNLGESLESFDPAGFDAADAGVLARLRSSLRRWRGLRDSVSADRILIDAMDEVGYEMGLTPRGRVNVEKLLSGLREQSRRRSLDEIVDELALIRDSDPREQDSQSVEAGDCVRVQTIHSAKGLEFPIVFLPALQAGVQNEVDPILYSPRLGLGVRWRNPATGHSLGDVLYEAIAEEHKRKEMEEAGRLFYVATTRAEDHLVLSFSSTGTGFTHWAERLDQKLGVDLRTPTGVPRQERLHAPDGSEFLLRVLATATPPLPWPAFELTSPEETTRLVEPPALEGQHDSTVSVTALSLFTHCPRRYFLSRSRADRSIRPPEEATLARQERDPLDASEFGSQVHALLAGEEVANPHPEALALAARFHDSELGRRAARTLLAEREFDFLLAVDDVVLRGQIDLWFEDSGELILVDYKTDEVDADEAQERAQSYSSQLRLYALALERFTGRSVDRTYLHLLRPNLALPVDVTGAAESAAGMVRSFRSAQEHGDFPLREGRHCLRCPYYGGPCPARAVAVLSASSEPDPGLQA